MGAPMFKVLTGATNGVNATFSFGVPFVPFTAVVLLNGQVALHSSGNPWSENAAAGTITFEPGCEPRIGDVVSGFAIYTSVDPAYVTRAESTLLLDSDRRTQCVVEAGGEHLLSLERHTFGLVVEASAESTLSLVERETVLVHEVCS